MTEDAKLLVDFARRGDVNALSAVVVRHSPWMSALLKGLLPEADVEDALQNAWLKVIKSAKDFRGEGLKSYLATIVRSVAVDMLRKGGRTAILGEESSIEDDEKACGDFADPSPAPDERFVSAATKAEVLSAVRTLPEGPRQVLLLRVEAEMSFREIAEELHIPLGTALTWMRTATLRLKDLLGGTK